MIQFWAGILGGLIGSIVTVVITKLLDIFQKSKEHKYDLEKKFFEKKLAAAEAAITQYTILSNSFTNLTILYERIDQQENEIEEYIVSHLHQQATQQLELANNASFIIANSITLYFDIQFKGDQESKVRNFYALLSSLGPLEESTNMAFEYYIKTTDTTEKNAAYKSYLKCKEELREQVKLVAKTVNSVNQEIRGIINQIKDDMSRFDY